MGEKYEKFYGKLLVSQIQFMGEKYENRTCRKNTKTGLVDLLMVRLLKDVGSQSDK
jgi:hypothetical protein